MVEDVSDDSGLPLDLVSLGPLEEEEEEGFSLGEPMDCSSVTQVLCVEGSPFCALRSRVRATQALCFQGSRSALAGLALCALRVRATLSATGEACAVEPVRPALRREDTNIVIGAQTPGPTAYAATQARDIASAFHLFVTPAIERIIVEMTNLHGARKYGDGWRPMDATDLHAYLGLLILAGVYRSRGEAAASLWDAESGRTVFRATMSLKVFHRYSRLLRFDDRQSRPARLATDKLAAIREVWDLWEARLPALYNPGPDVTVDEQLVPFRGRCPFRQYIPSKPAKYGIKSWVACDAKSSYAWKMQVYTGKAAGGGPEKNQGMRVVLDLTTGLSGRNVTCDNFFTSYDLGQRLLERNLTMVGTVRKNKAELPPALLESRGRQVLSSRFAFTPTATLVSYLAKRNKNVLLLSTLHTEGHISDRRDKKPALILDYNCNKGGVDNLDKVVGTYSCRRMTARWPLVVFHNILDVSSYNAFVIWREIKPDWMPGKRNKRRVFLEQLGKALVKPLIQRRQHLPRTERRQPLSKSYRVLRRRLLINSARAPPLARPLPARCPATTGASKRKRCQLCPPKKDSKTHTDFGLDVENLVGDCPTPFLNLAVFCCNMNSKLRLSFSEIVVLLEGWREERKKPIPLGDYLSAEPTTVQISPYRRQSSPSPWRPAVVTEPDLNGGHIKLYNTPSKSVIS
ncbi:piggyBac transposable element-derived protein 4-like [Oncorhynchus tshawytscha]|uniref:piggyBac transposable element-derived protein 4-like n=1 Tax=Oncorhynchus tshawytscha TaxID=74940 RepID=UPI001C3C33BF|nr:piggyBac transposable element-derived protein 4-like [Oncorhynchus tshawytscha]